MKKVEVIIESIYINRLIDMFDKYKITSYTLIRDVEGCGSHGLHMNDGVSEVDGNDYFFTAVQEEKFLEIKKIFVLLRSNMVVNVLSLIP